MSIFEGKKGEDDFGAALIKETLEGIIQEVVGEMLGYTDEERAELGYDIKVAIKVSKLPSARDKEEVIK